jgi:hypothetical protein
LALGLPVLAAQSGIRGLALSNETGIGKQFKITANKFTENISK